MEGKIPELVFVCGCNGAGKSTLTYSTIKEFGEIYFIDPDRIAKEENLSAIDAGKKVSEKVKNFLDKKISFVKESTLTSNFDFSVARKAKEIGFKTTLIYVGIKNVELAILRVKKRIENGGHSVPEEDIRRRYDRSLTNLVKAIQIFDHTFVYDNTDSLYRMVAMFYNGKLTEQRFTPEWFKKIEKEFQVVECQSCNQNDVVNERNTFSQPETQPPVVKKKRHRL